MTDCPPANRGQDNVGVEIFLDQFPLNKEGGHQINVLVPGVTSLAREFQVLGRPILRIFKAVLDAILDLSNLAVRVSQFGVQELAALFDILLSVFPLQLVYAAAIPHHILPPLLARNRSTYALFKYANLPQSLVNHILGFIFSLVALTECPLGNAILLLLLIVQPPFVVLELVHRNQLDFVLILVHRGLDLGEEPVALRCGGIESQLGAQQLLSFPGMFQIYFQNHLLYFLRAAQWLSCYEEEVTQDKPVLHVDQCHRQLKLLIDVVSLGQDFGDVLSLFVEIDQHHVSLGNTGNVGFP